MYCICTYLNVYYLEQFKYVITRLHNIVLCQNKYSEIIKVVCCILVAILFIGRYIWTVMY